MIFADPEYLRRLGVPESVAMKISGKTRSIFERYNILDKSEVVDATRKLNEQQKSIAPASPDLAILHGQDSGIVTAKNGANADGALACAAP